MTNGKLHHGSKKASTKKSRKESKPVTATKLSQKLLAGARKSAGS